MILIQDDNINGSQSETIENLLQTSCLDELQRSVIERQLPYMTNIDAEKAIEYLINNQLDPFTQTGNYSIKQLNHTHYESRN